MHLGALFNRDSSDAEVKNIVDNYDNIIIRLLKSNIAEGYDVSVAFARMVNYLNYNCGAKTTYVIEPIEILHTYRTSILLLHVMLAGVKNETLHDASTGRTYAEVLSCITTIMKYIATVNKFAPDIVKVNTYLLHVLEHNTLDLIAAIIFDIHLETVLEEEAGWAVILDEETEDTVWHPRLNKYIIVYDVDTPIDDEYVMKTNAFEFGYTVDSNMVMTAIYDYLKLSEAGTNKELHKLVRMLCDLYEVRFNIITL